MENSIMYDVINLQIQEAWHNELTMFEVVERNDTEIFVQHINNEYYHNFSHDHKARHFPRLVSLLNKLGIIGGRRIFRCRYPEGSAKRVVLGELVHKDGKFVEYKHYNCNEENHTQSSMSDVNKKLERILFEDCLNSKSVSGWHIGLTAVYDNEVTITINRPDGKSNIHALYPFFYAKDVFIDNLLMTLYDANILLDRHVNIAILVGNEEVDFGEVYHSGKTFSGTGKLYGFAMFRYTKGIIDEFNRKIRIGYSRGNRTSLPRPPRHAAFEIIALSGSIIFIRDLYALGGSFKLHKTVTNDAEWVVETLRNLNILYGRRLFYRDSEGQIDEIIRTPREFLGFKKGDPQVVKLLETVEQFVLNDNTGKGA
jgi:hypothetical protein